MIRFRRIADQNYLKTQYRNASNLNTRIRLHKEFSTNKYGWHRWLFEQINIPPQGRVLELGCGAGNLWLDNFDRIPAGLKIILSDFSEGILEQVQKKLAISCIFFQFMKIDAQFIPFENASFDIVIANHMLYHLTELDKALSEIKRVLKPTGRFYASTSGRNHMKELSDLARRFDSRLASLVRLTSDTFKIENGAAQLANFFASISFYRYSDSLIVTDACQLIQYILSGRIKLSPDKQLEFARFVEQELKANDGKFYIRKDLGVFESNNILSS